MIMIIVTIIMTSIITMILTKVRGEGRLEDKSSTLTGLNLIYPGLLVFYVEVGQIQKLSRVFVLPCQQT